MPEPTPANRRRARWQKLAGLLLLIAVLAWLVVGILADRHDAHTRVVLHAALGGPPPAGTRR